MNIDTNSSPVSTEGQLLEIAGQAMIQTGWPTTVLIGPLTFPLGENERNVKSMVHFDV